MQSGRIVYYLLLSWTCFAALIIEYKKITNKRFAYLLVTLLPLIFFAAFRGESVGADTSMYIEEYSILNRMPIQGYLTDNFEFGYVCLNKFLGLFFLDGYAVIFTSSVITILGIGWFFYKNASNIYLAVISFVGLYIYFQTYTFVRQSLAMVFFCIAIPYLIRGERIKYVCFILLGTLFHLSLGACLFFTFLYPLSIKKILVYIFALSFLIYQVFSGGIILLAEYFDEGFKYLAYIGSQHDLALDFGPAILKALLCIGTSSLFLWYTYKERKQSEMSAVALQRNYWYALLTFTAGLVVIAGYASVILDRFEIYFYMFLCLLLPELLNRIGFWKKYMAIFIYVILLFFYLNRMMALAMDPRWIDYFFIFE